MRRQAFAIASLIALYLTCLPDTPVTAGPPDPGPQIAISEMAGTTSTLWAVNPADPRRRLSLATVEHADGWGLRASTSADGRHIAYLTLPPGSHDAARQAELWLYDVAAGAPRRLDGGLDLLGTPVWAPDGSLVVARRITPSGQRSDIGLLGYPVSGSATPQTLASVTDVDWGGAIGWWQGVLIYASIDAGGTYLHAGGPAPMLLTTGIARDFRLDAAKGHLGFTAIAGPGQALAGTLDVASRRVATVPKGSAPQRDSSLPSAARRAIQGAGHHADTLAATDDGRWRVVSALRPADNSGYLAVAGADGVRPVTFRGHIEFVGWLK